MYTVTITTKGTPVEVHNRTHKLLSGSVVQGVNAIDSFSFTIAPKNPGFNWLLEYATRVDVYNDVKYRYEFQGRVLTVSDSMDDSGLITKDVVCESFLGYLCDSRQTYVAERNWQVRELLSTIITRHNSQVEDHKKIRIGNVDITDPNDNLYCGIQRESTLDTIKKKLVEVLGGELRLYENNGALYLDYVPELGTKRSTEIALSKNMKAITRDIDPTEYVTRLIPLGNKLKLEQTTTDSEGNETVETVETEERLDIAGVNGGSIYIDDTEAIELYGVHVEVMEWDDVSDATNLLNKGREWLEEHNRVQVKYSITALDLSLLGLELDEFNVYDYYPVKNRILGIDDTARVIKKTIDVCDMAESNIEIGDNFKTLSELQRDRILRLEHVVNTIEHIEKNYVTNERLFSESRKLSSLITQTSNEIELSVSEEYESRDEAEEYRRYIETQLQLLSDEIVMNFKEEKETHANHNSKFETIYKYISFKGGNITMGEDSNPLTLSIAKEKIVFNQNGVEKGYWDGDNFYTGNIVVRVDERAQFGNFAFVPRSDGSLMFKKVGG